MAADNGIVAQHDGALTSPNCSLLVCSLSSSSGLVLVQPCSLRVWSFGSEGEAFTASVDSPIGTNQYILVEVDEGDNDEHIHHVFSSRPPTVADSSLGILVMVQPTGALTNHFTEPGYYTVQ